MLKEYNTRVWNAFIIADDSLSGFLTPWFVGWKPTNLHGVRNQKTGIWTLSMTESWNRTIHWANTGLLQARRILWKTGIVLSSWTTVSFSCRTVRHELRYFWSCSFVRYVW